MKRSFIQRCKELAIREIRETAETIKYWGVLPFAKLLYRNRTIYLISERGTDARDNAYHLFKYICKYYPELDVYYIISEDSVDRNKVASLGNVINYRSLKHYCYFIASKYKISTHVMGYSPDMMFYNRFNQKHRIPGKQIFLQHGVIKDDLVGLYQEKTKLDVFITGAEPEYKYVNSKFNYTHGEVHYTGLARYDNLYDNKIKEQILIMPTWRAYLKVLGDNERKGSQYFKLWNKVLHDSRIIDKLREHGMKMVFYPHYEMQPYINEFVSDAAEIIIADFEHYDVQTLLKESKLMITDFSSVFFDFAYMRKPCIYYQFDKELFFSTHYQKGYFDYETMGFGEVVQSHEELVKTLLDYMEQNCQMKAEYNKRAKDFFPLHDNNNCKRIMEVIREIK